MKFLVISDTKLKVTLSKSECKDYDIDMKCSEFSSNEIRLVLKDILKRAENECGFRSAGEKILVQLYPMPDGSGELFVTKLVNLPWREQEIVSECDTLTTYEEELAVFRFDSKELLLSALNSVYSTAAPCDIYLADSGEYYINIKEERTNGISNIEILTEYGKRLESLPIYVNGEYGKQIACKDGLAFAKRKLDGI